MEITKEMQEFIYIINRCMCPDNIICSKQVKQISGKCFTIDIKHLSPIINGELKRLMKYFTLVIRSDCIKFIIIF